MAAVLQEVLHLFIVLNTFEDFISVETTVQVRVHHVEDLSRYIEEAARVHVAGLGGRHDCCAFLAPCVMASRPAEWRRALGGGLGRVSGACLCGRGSRAAFLLPDPLLRN